jgi:hypothetical protein
MFIKFIILYSDLFLPLLFYTNSHVSSFVLCNSVLLPYISCICDVYSGGPSLTHVGEISCFNKAYGVGPHDLTEDLDQ